MSKISITFTVFVPYESIKEAFNQVIDCWVVSRQSTTSGIVKAMILGDAISQGSSFLGALVMTKALGQGMQQVTTTSAKIMIPASGTTYGGEMTVTASPLEDGSTKIFMSGHTQGLLSGTLKENINGLRDYLIQTLPGIETQYKEAEKNKMLESTSGVSISREIEALHDLHKKGALNDDEYTQAKKRVLDRPGA